MSEGTAKPGTGGGEWVRLKDVEPAMQAAEDVLVESRNRVIRAFEAQATIEEASDRPECKHAAEMIRLVLATLDL